MCNTKKKEEQKKKATQMARVTSVSQLGGLLPGLKLWEEAAVGES